MTVIIYTGGALVADCASSRDNFSVHNAEKLHTRGDIVWGNAGVSPSVSMLNATSMDQLAAAVVAEAVTRAGDAILLWRKTDKSAWLGSIEAKHGGAVHYEWCSVSPGAVIGRYRLEWYNTLARQRSACALKFCGAVTELWGLTRRADTAHADNGNALAHAVATYVPLGGSADHVSFWDGQSALHEIGLVQPYVG